MAIDPKDILALNLKDGDVVFVDANKVDLDQLQCAVAGLHGVPGIPKVTFIPLLVLPGETLRDAIEVMAMRDGALEKAGVKLK